MLNKPSYAVRLDFFEGPLDLLLHLVHQREVPIGQVNMSQLCEQYLEIVSRAVFIDLDKATEFLVIAATLMAIKSQALLPNQSLAAEAELEDDFDTRFFEDLREKLRVYELTKKRAHRFVAMPQLGVDTFSRGQRNELQVPLEVSTSGDVLDIGRAFLLLLRRIGANVKTLAIRLEPVSVVSYMMKVIDLLGGKGSAKARFLTVVQQLRGDVAPPAAADRGAIIGPFIAILELVRRGVLGIDAAGAQGDEFSVRLRGDHAALSPLELRSEFDRVAEHRVAVASGEAELGSNVVGANEDDVIERREASI